MASVRGLARTPVAGSRDQLIPAEADKGGQSKDTEQLLESKDEEAEHPQKEKVPGNGRDPLPAVPSRQLLST